MSTILVRIVAAGILFGAWPLLMNRSDLVGTTSAFVYNALALAIVLPFIAGQGGLVTVGADWKFAVAAGVCGGVGILLLMDTLAKIPAVSVGRLLVIMIIIQIAVVALYDVILNGIALRRIVGFAVAALATYLLL